MLFLTYQSAKREPLLDVAEERDAIIRWQDFHDPAALELLLRSHARQAWAQASRWTKNPAHLEDLVAEGMIGLMRAADNFDRHQEVRFSTYSAWWVLTGIASALARIKLVIDVPTRTYLAARGGKLPEAERDLVRMATQGTVTLDATLVDGESRMTDTIVCDGPTPEESATLQSLRSAQARLLDEALAELDPREADVIRRRKLRPEPDSVAEVAADLDMSPAKLRQYEKRAMLRLRQRLIEHGYSPAMLG